jgi:hypothetical protein
MSEDGRQRTEDRRQILAHSSQLIEDKDRKQRIEEREDWRRKVECLNKGQRCLSVEWGMRKAE